MGLMELRRSVIIGGYPHPVTKSGSIVQFETDMVGLMQITPQTEDAYIYTNGSNIIPNKKYVASTTIYLGHEGSGYTIFLRPATYTITVEMLNGADYNLYFRGSNASSATAIWAKGNNTTTATFTISTVDLYRFNFYDANGTSGSNVGRFWLNIGNEQLPYEEYKGTVSQQLTGRKTIVGQNNIWSDSGNVTVEYWVNKPVVASN